MEQVSKNVLMISDGRKTAIRAAAILRREDMNVSVMKGDKISDDASLLLVCDGGIASPSFELIESIRRTSDIPIITISEGCDEIYRTVALAKGADMCMDAENLGSMELRARVNALIRRYCAESEVIQENDSLLVNGGIALDRRSREVYSEGTPVKMTATQFGIVEYLMENCGRVCSIEEIYSSVWRETPYSVHRTVVDHIRRIRGKLEPDPHNPRYIKAVFGVGYKMEKKYEGVS